jgi:hypothetical protein
MTEADTEIAWPKIRIEKSHFVLLTELGDCPTTGGINWKDVIPHETDINFYRLIQSFSMALLFRYQEVLRIANPRVDKTSLSFQNLSSKRKLINTDECLTCAKI